MLELLLVFAAGLEKEKAFRIALGKWLKQIYMFWKIKKNSFLSIQ